MNKNQNIQIFNVNRLRSLRYERKLSAKEVANALCISDATLSAYENGRTKIPACALFSLCQLYHIAPNEFYLGGGCGAND